MSCRLLLAVLFTVVHAALAHGHLIAEQRATLNVVDNGVFLVISVPASALTGVDSDGDGKVSAQELSANLAAVRNQIVSGVVLYDGFGDALPLEGLMMSLSPPHDDPAAPSEYLVAMGRFAMSPSTSVLELEISLLGDATNERSYEVSARRGESSEKMTLTSSQNRHKIAFNPLTLTTNTTLDRQ